MTRCPANPLARSLACCVFLWTLHGAAAAMDVIDLPGTANGRIELAGHFEVLVDESGRLTLDDVLASGGFETTDRAGATFGFTNDAVWAHLRLRYPPDAKTRYVLSTEQTLIDRAELYVVDAGRRHPVRVTGDALPFATRDVMNRNVNFELAPRPGEVVDYYLRVTGPTSAISVPLSLWTRDGFDRHAVEEQVLIGGYFGAMATLALTAFLLFALVHEMSFLFFGAYLVAYGLVMSAFSGYGFQYLWPDDPLLQQRLPTLAIALSVLTGTLVGRRFLDTPRLVPASEWIYGIAVVAAVSGAVLHVTVPGHLGSQLTIGAVLLLVPSVMYLGVRCAKLGDRIARFWLVGWTLYVLGVCSVALHSFGLVPNMPLTVYGMYLGSLADFMSLSIALSARVWSVRREKTVEVAQVASQLAELNDNLENIVSERTHELQERNRELSELATRDSLTGLYNHSTSIEMLDQLLQQSQRYKFPLATIMVDIDHFKAINDSFGHQVGDRVLESVSEALTDSVRGSDMVGRYGGEEFLIAMSHADAFAAREYGERLLQKIREIGIPTSNGGSITASLGITVYYPHGFRDSAQEVIQRADEALYRSKTDGRDRLTIESLSLVPGTGAKRSKDDKRAPVSVENPPKPA